VEIDGSIKRPPSTNFGVPFFRIETGSPAVTANTIEFIARENVGGEIQ
jgi:hypothetical protein